MIGLTLLLSVISRDTPDRSKVRDEVIGPKVRHEVNS